MRTEQDVDTEHPHPQFRPRIAPPTTASLATASEAEGVLPQLIRSLLAGDVVARRCHEATADVAMDSIPSPIYDDYFARCEALPAALLADFPPIRVPIETARGCWWGQKSHCTFCGLNGSSMAFRHKSVDRAFAEFETLARRHRQLSFDVVDNIIANEHVRGLLPRLAASGFDFDLMYETKANLTKEQLQAFADAGVSAIQPGIESLDTGILKLMRKGTSALQNIRLLKWCAELGIQVHWNVLMGFGNEDPAAYERMAELVGALHHLEPPSATFVVVNRFSPMHRDPAAHGLVVDGPVPFYRHVFPGLSAAQRNDLAYFFESHHASGADYRSYTQVLSRALAQWRRASAESFGRLTYVRGPGFVRIRDDRPGSTNDGEYTLTDDGARIFELCDEGRTSATVCERLRAEGRELSVDDVEEFLEHLVAARLVLRVDGRYLSLPLCAARTNPRSPATDTTPVLQNV